MRKLDADFCPISVDKVDDTLERGDMLLAPYAIIFRGDATFGKDGGRFHGDGTGSSSGETPKMQPELAE